MEKKTVTTHWAFRILVIGFTIAPILSGLDKFTNLLTTWSMYLAPVVVRTLPLPANIFMRCVGVVEICAGITVALKPRVGGMIVSIWLVAIIINLLLAGGFYDIVLRDLGLALGALSLFFLSKECACES